jgi:hypothetical protein
MLPASLSGEGWEGPPDLSPPEIPPDCIKKPAKKLLRVLYGFH